MTTVAIHQPQYLPWIPYLAKAAACDTFVYLDNVQFQKNGVQNRNQIKTANGPVWLTVPVKASLQNNINNTLIDNSQNWRSKHIKSIENAYARAPFKHLFDNQLRQIIEKDWTYLADLNIAVTEWMFEQLNINCKRVLASDLDICGTKEALILSICKATGATSYLSGEGGKSYQDSDKFKKNGIFLVYQEYIYKTYTQCHSKQEFSHTLSGLDLILNLGDESRCFL